MLHTLASFQSLLYKLNLFVCVRVEMGWVTVTHKGSPVHAKVGGGGGGKRLHKGVPGKAHYVEGVSPSFYTSILLVLTHSCE
jgi:hypothetical protein